MTGLNVIIIALAAILIVSAIKERNVTILIAIFITILLFVTEPFERKVKNVPSLWKERVENFKSTTSSDEGYFEISKKQNLSEWILTIEKIHSQIKEERKKAGKPVFDDPFFIASIAITESVPKNGDTINPEVKSSAGAYGTMQVLKSTALQMGCTEDNWKMYYHNIKCGISYLYYLADLYWEIWPEQNDQFYKLVAVGYHSGQGNVKAWMKQEFGKFSLPEDVMNVIPMKTSNGKPRIWGRVYPQRTYGIRTALHHTLTGVNKREKCIDRPGIQKYLKRPEESDSKESHAATYDLACRVITLIPGVIYFSGLNDTHHRMKFSADNRHPSGLAIDLSVLPHFVDIDEIANKIRKLAPGLVTVKVPKCTKCTAKHIHVEFKGSTVEKSLRSAEEYMRVKNVR